MKRAVLILGVFALGAMSLAVASATGRSVATVKSTATITSGEGTEFSGKVSSAKKQCRAGRTVKLYMKAGTARLADSLVGTATTNASGAWTIDGSFMAAEYYVRVAAVLVEVNGFQYRCSYAWSMPRQF